MASRGNFLMVDSLSVDAQTGPVSLFMGMMSSH